MQGRCFLVLGRRFISSYSGRIMSMLVLWVSGFNAYRLLLTMFHLGIDDVFVRTDLSQGKYKIDIRAAKEFELYNFYDPEDEIPFPWERDEL